MISTFLVALVGALCCLAVSPFSSPLSLAPIRAHAGRGGSRDGNSRSTTIDGGSLAPRPFGTALSSSDSSTFSPEPIPAPPGKGAKDLVSAKIRVYGGGVHGGFYRASALNQAKTFRKLKGSLTELSAEGDEPNCTEMYVEGKLNLVHGFVRWCQKSPGLQQEVFGVEVEWGECEGLFDDFYLPREN